MSITGVQPYIEHKGQCRDVKGYYCKISDKEGTSLLKKDMIMSAC
jgi:hypothetical protein